MTAPTAGGLGRALMSADIIRGLGEINSNIRAWEQYQSGHWWPGIEAVDETGGVLTCLWIGEPGGHSRKITAIRNGPIPEYTVLQPNGSIKLKGWRAIFFKVIVSGAATQRQIEQKFQVSLDSDSPDKTVWCTACKRNAKWVKSNGGSARLCSVHDKMRELALHAKATHTETRVG